MLIDVYNFLDKSSLGKEEFDLSRVLDTKVNMNVIHEHVVKMKKYNFVPTAYTKCIAEISATTKKPFAQKGGGRSRQGTTVGAQHRGGVKIFGPRAIKRTISIPKKEVALVKRMLLKIAIESNKFFIVNNCNVPDYKTKNSLLFKKSFGLENGSAIVLHNNEISNNNVLSSRNTSFLSYSRVTDFTVHSLASANIVVITKSAVNKLFGA